MEAIAALEKVIAAYPFAKREAEQTELREKRDLAYLTRRENFRRQTEAEAQVEALQARLEEKNKEVHHCQRSLAAALVTAAEFAYGPFTPAASGLCHLAGISDDSNFFRVRSQIEELGFIKVAQESEAE